jgi:hypothetical protein
MSGALIWVGLGREGGEGSQNFSGRLSGSGGPERGEDNYILARYMNHTQHLHN